MRKGNQLKKSTISRALKNTNKAISYMDIFLNYQLDIFFESSGYSHPNETDNYELQCEGFCNELLYLAHDITRLNHLLIDYLQNEPKIYQEHFINRIMPEYYERLVELMSIRAEDGFDGMNIDEKMYYAWEFTDRLQAVYASLNCLLEIFTNIRNLIIDSSELDQLLDYQIELNDTLEAMGYKSSYLSAQTEDDKCSNDTFTWTGTPSELALLFSTLVENGYIEPPLLSDGRVNKSSLSRKINTHFTLAKGAVKSVLNALGENTITPDNQFYIAMNKVPRNRKEA